ncbi:HAMP domain-containing histidine kinase [Streptomyces sp. YC504]|uniref:histidine kinase n=1 Tax=Streptomyces mesophilus TaxID=1775132 RepID=A0A6G4XNX2_9ACTN|nr:HAMP domain-containing sensor histidine kinase [Streptomyces mesophilus]NGO78510.1 HAMP domain-containing histidine kinase [Streptomyces mesophilus]
MKRLRAVPLRTRLALLTAAAVAFAVAAVSVTCWFIVRANLYQAVDDDLTSSATSTRPAPEQIRSLLTECAQAPSPDRTFPGVRSAYYGELVKADGTACVFSDSVGKVNVTTGDTDVAMAADPDVASFRNGTDADGNRVRVLTKALIADGPGGRDAVVSDTALLLAYPLKETESTLNELALILLLASGVGVLGAGAAGLWTARAGLKPVDQLADTVEHVARTEDLTIRIPAEGDDEIARLSRSFNAMTAALESSQERQAQLIADAGHELRTPLTSLRTNIELLARSEETGRAIPPDDRKALLASVKAQMTELAALIGDLQELARPDTGQTAKVEVVGFHQIVQTAVDRARLRGPELEITAELAPWYVRADAAALERALVNILDNAVKFSPPGGAIEVALDRGTLTVRDHGPGIPAEELPYVFDRFWRSPTARQLPGSGLGLSIVARTVQQSGGEVALRPADGGGTVAVVRLPGAPSPPPERPA